MSVRPTAIHDGDRSKAKGEQRIPDLSSVWNLKNKDFRVSKLHLVFIYTLDL